MEERDVDIANKAVDERLNVMEGTYAASHIWHISQTILKRAQYSSLLSILYTLYILHKGQTWHIITNWFITKTKHQRSRWKT